MTHIATPPPTSHMGFDLSPQDDAGSEEKLQTEKFIKIITTFASRVDISVCKAQVTIDVLLSQYGLSLTPKEVVEDDTSGVKAVVAVIRRAAVLQRDVDRLGQILVTRTAPSVSNRHPKEEVNAMDASTKDEDRLLLESDVLFTPNDYSHPKQDNHFSPKQDNLPSTNTPPPKQDNLPSTQDDLPPKRHEHLLPKQESWVPVKASNSNIAIQKSERLLSPKPERSLSPKPEGTLSPKPERTLSPKPDDNLLPSIPKKEISPPTIVNRIRSPSPTKLNTDRPPTNNVSNLKAIFRDPKLQGSPSSPKVTNARPPVTAAQIKPSSSLLAKSLSTSVIPSSQVPLPSGLTKQPSFTGGSHKVSPPPPKQYMTAPPPPSNAAGNQYSTNPSSAPPPPSNNASSPPVSPTASFMKATIKKAPPQGLGRGVHQYQSSPSLTADLLPRSAQSISESPPTRAIPLSPRATSPTPPPPSLPASSSFLSSTPPPSATAKSMLKGAPIKKPPAITSSASSPPPPACTPPVNSAVGSISATPPQISSTPPKRPARSASNSPHPVHSASDHASSPPSKDPPSKENSWSGAIDIPSRPNPSITLPSPNHDEPIPLSSSLSNNEPLTDDTTHSESTPPFDVPTDDSDTTSYYSQSTTPNSTLNFIPNEISKNIEILNENFDDSALSPIPLDDPPRSQEHPEPPTTPHLSIVDDLDGLELDDDDDDNSIHEEKKDKAKDQNKFDTIKLKKDINALLDAIDKEEAIPAKRVNPRIKDKLSPFFTKRPKNKQELETTLKDKGIVPKDEKRKKEKH